jgi:four helix bundle protein
MKTNSTTRLVGTLLDLLDDFVAEFRSRMIATQLIRSVASTAAQYRAAQRTRSGTRMIAKMCLVLEESDRSSAWLARAERHRLSRRLEPIRQALFVADEIIEKTFSPRRNVRRLPAYATLPNPKSSRS